MAQHYPYFGNSLHQAEVIELYETLRDSNLLDDINKAKINENKLGLSCAKLRLSFTKLSYAS